MPQAWPDPDASLDQKQFFAVLEDCLAKLPAKTSQAFMMREHMGFETTKSVRNSPSPRRTAGCCCTARASRCACAWK